MAALVLLMGLIYALCQVQVTDGSNVAAVRFAHYEILTQQYARALKENPNRSPVNGLRLCHEFMPKFLALAQEDPSDEAALRCCEWIVVQCRPDAQDGELSEAEATAWKIIADNRSNTGRLPALCLEASQFPSQIREDFLRSLPKDYRQPVEVHGNAYLALAELLAKKATMSASSRAVEKRPTGQWSEPLSKRNSQSCLRESADLYHHVLAYYADIPYTLGATDDSEPQTLGERAAKGLSRIESAQIARKPTNEVIERPASRFDHLSGN